MVEHDAHHDLVVAEVGHGVVDAVWPEVAEALEAAQHQHREHGAVEDVAELALRVVRHQVVQVAVVVGQVLLFLKDECRLSH